MSEGIGGLILFASIAGFIAVMAGCQSFQARCDRAGFEGAAHERCVMRLSAGGPIYPENIGYKP